jgi:hypothetical protein
MKKIFIVLTVFFASACNNNKPDEANGKKTPGPEAPAQTKIPATMAADTSKIIGADTYTIDAIDGWEKKDTSIRGLKLTRILSPFENKEDKLRENVNVTTEKAKHHNLDEYVSKNMEDLQKQLKTVRIIDQGNQTVGGEPAKWFKYYVSVGVHNLENKAFFIVKNDIGFVITFTSAQGNFAKYESRFNTILNTFKIN